MQRETEQMAAIADHRQGSHTDYSPVPFERQLSRMAHEANNRLALALDQEAAAQRAKLTALAEQQKTMRALAAVLPQDDQVERGRTLAARAGVSR